jgi:hypothetical protein
MVWRVSAVVLTVVLALVLFGSALACGEVSIAFDSHPGDYIGGGQKQTFTPGTGTFAVSRNFDNGVSITFNGGASSTWTLDFAAPFNGTLMSGAYENVQRFPFQSPTAPGLSVWGAGRGCNSLTGRFVVLYAVYAPAGDVTSFGVDFEQHCEGLPPALFGQIRFSPSLLSAVLPGSRSVQAVGGVASAFAAVINPAATGVTNCVIAPTTPVPGTFLYQTTDPGTNQLIGTPNTPFAIAAGGLQTLYLAFTLGGVFSPTDVHLYFVCSTDFAPVVVGLNTLLLSASAVPGPDIIALAATIGGDGIVNVPTASGTGVFAVGTANVGTPGTITVTADTGGVALPLTSLICQTNPTTGTCLAPPTTSVTVPINAGATPTFGVFVTETGTITFSPATNRVFVRFKEGGVTHGSTSVAVRTQ